MGSCSGNVFNIPMIASTWVRIPLKGENIQKQVEILKRYQ